MTARNDGFPLNRDRINAAVALELHDWPHFKTWREIGAILAHLDDRPIPYLGQSVACAAMRARKAQT